MAETVPAQIEANLFNSLSSVSPETETVTKAEDAPTPEYAFIKKHIHPPSAVPNYEGMPTNDARTQVVVNWVQFGVLNQSAVSTGGVSPTPFALSNNEISGVAFLVTSGLNHPIITFAQKDDGSWQQDVYNSGALDVYDVKGFYKDCQVFRPTYKSVTTYLNATAFNDTGIVSSYQFNPAVIFTGTLEEFAEKHSRKFLCWYKQQLESPNPRRFNHEHHLAFMQHMSDEIKRIEKDYDKKNARKDNFEDDLEFAGVNLKLQVIDFGKQGNPLSGNASGAVVPTISQIMNASTRSYGGKAKDGTFNVQRLNTTAPAWMPTGNLDQNANNGGLFECWCFFEDVNGNDTFRAFEYAPNITSVVRCTDVTWSTDMTWSWIIYTGLSPNTSLTNVAASQTIAVKQYIGVEIQPSPKSAWAGMQKVGPRPDLDAMQALMLAYYDLKDSSPAINNFLAGALRVGARVAGRVVKGVAQQNGFGRARNQSKQRKRKNNNGTRKIKQNVGQTKMSMNDRFGGYSRQRSKSRGRSQSRGRSNSRPRSQSRRRPQRRRGVSFQREDNRERDLVHKVDDIEKKINLIKFD